MKIALITYHSANNYGATLQAYSTYRLLEELGYQVELIDLPIKECNPLFKKVLLLGKHLQFSLFRKKYFMKLTRRYYSLNDLQKNPPVADVYMVGSDQVWNPDISMEKSGAFFLDFGDDKVKRIAFASSFGKSEWQSSAYLTTDKAKSLLNRFNAIGVREYSGVDICDRVFKLKATQVLDPVLLHENFNNITGTIHAVKKEIVLYKIVNDPLFYVRAYEIGSYFKMPLRSIGSIRKFKNIQCAYPESLGNWIKAIAESSFVLTDSFHGTVLSLLYHKQFIVYVGNSKLVTRIESLLVLFGLEERLCTSSDSANHIIEVLKTPINYQSVSLKLNQLRKESLLFLNNSLTKW